MIAFWVNLYNVIVIHGVIELGIRNSVKEVRNIFRRIQYQIGDMYFSPEDIEHGILRGNRKPPNSLFRVFSRHDKRLGYSVPDPDPRIHFAIVCASSSCPPIGAYSHENIDEELAISGRTFLNGGGAELDMQHKRISLSRIFKWYADDFGKSQNDILRFIAPYMYDENKRKFLLENAETIHVEYLDYDWRLNRN